jgi:DNA-binding transcriptional ArsR family regulator
MAAVTSKDIAIAAEAINRHRGLTPSARRVGLEILQGMDKRTATTWRSVRGIATRLDLAQSTIGYALRLLRDLGLIDTRAKGSKGLLFRISWSSLKRTAAMIKRSVAQKMGRHLKKQALVEPQERQPSRQSRGEALPPVKIYRGVGGGGAHRPPSQSRVPDQVLDQKAHGRLWQAIRGFGVELVTAVMMRDDAAELEAQAVRAERYRPGSGLGVVVERLRGNSVS